MFVFAIVIRCYRLRLKRMSSIYLKGTTEMSSKPGFPGFKIRVTGSLLGSSNSCRYHWLLKLFAATYKSNIWEQNCMWLFYYSNFERSYDVLKSKSPCVLLNKNKNINKNITESKMESLTHSFRERDDVLQLK